MAANGKEVIGGADLLQAQKIAEYPRQIRLHPRGRGAAFGSLARIRPGQRLAVQLAIGIDRQRIKHQTMLWYHEGRQLCRQGLKSRACVKGQSFGHHIGNQAGLAIGPQGRGQHHGISDLGLTHQAVGDLVGFNPLAADLDLMVAAPKICHVARRAPTGQIAGAIHTAAGHKGIGDENVSDVSAARPRYPSASCTPVR